MPSRYRVERPWLPLLSTGIVAFVPRILSTVVFCLIALLLFVRLVGALRGEGLILWGLFLVVTLAGQRFFSGNREDIRARLARGELRSNSRRSWVVVLPVALAMMTPFVFLFGHKPNWHAFYVGCFLCILAARVVYLIAVKRWLTAGREG